MASGRGAGEDVGAKVVFHVGEVQVADGAAVGEVFVIASRARGVEQAVLREAG